MPPLQNEPLQQATLGLRQQNHSFIGIDADGILIRHTSGSTLVLEVKGKDSPQDQAKRAALAQWIEAVNAHGGFGTWVWDVVVGSAAGMRDVMDKHA